MTGGGPRKAKPPVIRSPKESEIQEAIKEALVLAGFTVRHTSAFRQKGPSGVSPGIPDLLVYHSSLPGFYMGLEVKDAKGKPTPEQAKAIEAGEYPIVRKRSEALDHVEKIANFLNALQLKRIRDLANQFRRSGE